MIERLLSILPSLLCAIAAGAVALWWYSKQPRASQNLEERLRDIQNELSKFGVLAIVVAPCLEEVVFRAPLIVGFGDLNPTAWLMICQLGVVFGYIHVTATHTQMYKAFPSSMKRLVHERLVYVGFTALLGILLGYLAVQFHSLLLVVAVHACWNSLHTLQIQKRAYKEVERDKKMGEEVQSLDPGRSFKLHLQHGTNQLPHSSVFFEKGWGTTGPKVQDSFKANGEEREVPYRIYKIRASTTEAHVFALPVER